LKIIFSTDIIQRGGKERQLFLLTRALLEKGETVRIIAKKFSNDNYLSEYGLNGIIIKLTNGKSGFFRRFQHFKEIISKEQPDLLVTWDLQSSLFALLLIRAYDFHFINASIQHGVRLLRLSHFLRSIVCFLSTYVIANSNAGLKANNLRPSERRFVLYNGVETKFRNNLSPEEKQNLKNRLIMDYNKNPGFVYISVANFVPYKDYFTVLRTLSKLKETQHFYYFVLGDGSMRPTIEAQITEFNLQENVILVGRTENVNEYLFASDLMIHSSRGEGISNAILEAMYAGLPVIATNVGGVPETVYPASSMLFPYKDHEALYSCLLKSKELKESFDPSSKEYQAHLKKFSVDTMVRRFEEIVNTVISNWYSV